MKQLQIIGIALSFLIISSFVLMVLGRMPDIAFWIIAALTALVAYKVIPKMKEHGQ